MELRREQRRQKIAVNEDERTIILDTNRYGETNRFSPKIPSRENSQKMLLHTDYQNTAIHVQVKQNKFHPVPSVESSHSENINFSEDQQNIEATYRQTGSEKESEDGSIVKIELIHCKHCDKKYAPATYKRFCQALDKEGNPKCLGLLRNKKRKTFNSAKVTFNILQNSTM